MKNVEDNALTIVTFGTAPAPMFMIEILFKSAKDKKIAFHLLEIV